MLLTTNVTNNQRYSMDLPEFAMIDSHFAIFVDLSLWKNVSIKRMFEI